MSEDDLRRGLEALTERIERLEAAVLPTTMVSIGELHREIGALREQARRAKQDALDAQIGYS